MGFNTVLKRCVFSYICFVLWHAALGLWTDLRNENVNISLVLIVFCRRYVFSKQSTQGGTPQSHNSEKWKYQYFIGFKGVLWGVCVFLWFLQCCICDCLRPVNQPGKWTCSYFIGFTYVFEEVRFFTCFLHLLMWFVLGRVQSTNWKIIMILEGEKVLICWF